MRNISNLSVHSASSLASNLLFMFSMPTSRSSSIIHNSLRCFLFLIDSLFSLTFLRIWLTSCSAGGCRQKDGMAFLLCPSRYKSPRYKTWNTLPFSVRPCQSRIVLPLSFKFQLFFKSAILSKPLCVPAYKICHNLAALPNYDRLRSEPIVSVSWKRSAYTGHTSAFNIPLSASMNPHVRTSE